MADVFGDLDLFSEFDKDREAQGSFIHYDEDNSKSRIIFEDYASDESDSEEETLQPGESDNRKGSSQMQTESAENQNEEQQGEIEALDLDAEVKSEILADGDANSKVRKAQNTKDVKLPSADEKKVAWLNAQLYDEAAEEANKRNTSTQQLIYEKNKFRRYAKILDSSRYTPDDESPAVQLIFNNNSFARKHRQQIEQFIKGLLWEEFRTPKDTMSEVTVKPGNPSCVDINSNLPTEKRTERMRQKHALIGNSQFHKQFLIDFLGWPFNVAEPSRCNVNWEIPLYGQIFNDVYADPSNKAAKQSSKSSKPKPSCWNCNEPNHSVSDCSKPRNPAKIAASRKDFLAQQGSQNSGPKFSGPSRYHMDPELASKFARFKPGVISDGLQRALGLSSDQLPQHIYKMRLHGYPPGWLAEAKQVQSGVTIFDKHGRVALITGECLEDGELDDEDAEARTEYDVNKIIEYPGFTIPVPDGIHDEHVTFKMPPIQQHQLKKTLMAQSEKSTAKKSKRAREEDEDGPAVKKMKKEAANGDREEGEALSPSQEEEEKEEGEDDTEELAEESVTVTPVLRQSSTISVSKDFGTPIITREKSSLPDASKFGKDIEDHIPFENLPNATGTFEKMKELLDLIKKKTKKS